MARHFACERCAGFLHLGLDQAVSGFPHQRLAAEIGHAVVQRLRRLHVGDDRGTGQCFQNRLSEDAQNLVAPDNAAQAIDRADAIAIAVESQSEIELVVGDKLFEIGQILLFGGVGVMIGEGAVNIGEDREMFAGEQLDELFDHFASSAVARVPANAEWGAIRFLGIKTLDQPRDIVVDDDIVADRTLTGFPIGGFAQAVEIADVRSVKRGMGKHHLEAIILAGIVASGYLNAAVNLEHRLGIIEHGRRAQAYAHNVYAGFTQTPDKLALKTD